MNNNKKAKGEILWGEVIVGAIGVSGFAVFVVALAISVESWAFGIIMSIGLLMAIVDYFQSIRAKE